MSSAVAKTKKHTTRGTKSCVWMVSLAHAQEVAVAFATIERLKRR